MQILSKYNKPIQNAPFDAFEANLYQLFKPLSVFQVS